MPENLQEWITSTVTTWPGTGDPPVMPNDAVPELTVTQKATAMAWVAWLANKIYPGTTVITPGGLDPNGPQG